MAEFFINEVTVGTQWIDELVTAAGSGALVKFYTGTVPTDASVAPAGTLLGTLTISGSLGTVTAGTSGSTKASLAINVPPNANGIATGTPTYLIIETSAAVGVCGMDDGASGSGAYFILTPNTITQGAPISVSSLTITAP